MTLRHAILASALVLAPLGCSSKGSNYSFLPPTGGGGAGAVMPPTDKVMVTIVSPTTGTTVLDSTDISVSVTVDDNTTADFIDTSSVKMTLTAMGSTAAISTGQLIAGQVDASTGMLDGYSGALSIGNLPTGSYTLTVSAKSSTGVTGTAAITLMVQSGPTLIVNSPAENQPYSDLLTIEVLVDMGAPMPTAVLAGMPVTWPSGNPTQAMSYDVYRADVWFGPPPTPPGAQTFPMLSGKQLLDVKEMAQGSTSEVQRNFIIDTSGPTITMTTPAPGVIVGGPVQISAQITDESGVLPSSVQAVIGDDNGNPVFNLQLLPEGGDLYGIQFDTLNLTQCPTPPKTGPCIVFPTISFRATDSLGNESSLGYDFFVDNLPPLSDLDPPPVRQERLGAGGYQCSFLFDPLSVNKDVGDMPNDGCMVPQVFDLRARIEDQGNKPDGTKIAPIAGIDPDNTAVYILTDNSQPLVVDSNGDGSCDTINPLLSPTVGPLTQSDQVLKIRLAGVPPGGSADFRPDPSINASYPCGEGTDNAPPKVLCNMDGFEQPTIALAYADNDPAIWAVEPINTDRCFGNQLDTMANNIQDGQWVCIAVQSADLLGNKAVSKPMRVYINYNDPGGDPGGFCNTPPASAGPPPTCTGTYDPVGKTATQGACGTLTFPAGELYCAPGTC